MAASLLTTAYPELPVTTAAMEPPVDSGDAARVFSDAFARSAASAEIFRRLGLSSQSDPDQLAPTNCQVFDLLRRKVQDLAHPTDYSEIHHYLAHEAGLTNSLATLFLLLFACWETSELEVRLNSPHELTLADGRQLSAASLAFDTVPSLTWNDRLTESMATMAPVSPPNWQDALHHLAAICPKIRDDSAEEDQVVLEPHLLSAVESMQRRVQSSIDLLDTLCTGPAAATESSSSILGQTNTEALVDSLSRLSRVSGDGFEPIYLAIKPTYRDFSLLERDPEDSTRINESRGKTEEIRMAQIFMAGASVPPSGFSVLAVDKEALVNAASPVSLVRSRGSGWPAIAVGLESFKTRYSAVYGERHQWFYQVLPDYRTDLDAARCKLRAVELFDTLPELGPPSGSGLTKELSRLPDGPERHDRPFFEIEVGTSLRCPECGLSLDDTLPASESAWLMPTFEAGLSAKTRSLSGQLMSNVLRGGTGSQLKEFLKIVQASELNVLSNTLDPELLALIRSVLD